MLLLPSARSPQELMSLKGHCDNGHCGEAEVCEGDLCGDDEGGRGDTGRGCRQGPPMEIEKAVHKSTRAIADLYGLADRGSIAAGQKADINVIDYENLATGQPEYVNDFPLGGGRFVVKAQSIYEAKQCVVSWWEGEGEQRDTLEGKKITQF